MKIIRRTLMGVVAIAAAATLFMGWIGYFGGPLYLDVPAAGHRTAGVRTPVAAVLLSGDMGLRMGMGPDMAHRLAAAGVTVVGVNTLTYLRTTRTPAEITTLVADAARRALALGHADRVVLIGQSFGADMLHVGLARLPADLRARVAKVVLIVPEDNVQFRASPSEIFDVGTPTADALPTARLLTWAPTLCVQGRDEINSLCPLLTQANVRRVALRGGHPLNHDPDALYAVLSRFVLQ